MQVLIVGRMDGDIGAASRMALERGARLRHVEGVEDALAALRESGADLVMVDAALDVERLLGHLSTERIATEVVACGVGSDAGAAVRAIKAGAREYIPLPADPEMIAAVLEAVSPDQPSLLCRDPAMKRVLKLADQVAPSTAGVLIMGESGTGKELLARYLHRRSRRAEQRFVALNCAAIPESLLESELFGHEKGAFTGAVARRIGKFEEADGGSLLLDEISEMDVRLQAKLLRAIQEKEIDRLGGSRPVTVDTRLLATTNRDLQQAVRDGTFREDLYFRLNVITLTIPPLRDRPEDIELLANHFATVYAESNHLPQRPLAPEAVAALKTHPWPGNVRELENALHRAVLLAEGDRIGPEAFLLTETPEDEGHGAMAAATGTAGLVGRTVADVERTLILDTLQHCVGNRTHAASILGISIRTLRNKLKQYAEEGIPVPPPGESVAVD